ncbi:MAG: elongation factor G [Eubacteriales bacterium]|jgi:elongation factor G
MAKYTTDKIRNIALMGHSGSGKTSFAEAALYITKGTDRLGNPADGNTVCDYDPEEIRRNITISASIAPVLYEDCKINFIDTPGYLDFAGEVLQAVSVADAALIVMDGKAGIEVGTQLAWDRATEAGIPKSFLINKIDDPDAHFDKVVESLRETFGHSVAPMLVPVPDKSAYINVVTNKLVTFDKNGKETEEDIPAQYAEFADVYRKQLDEALAETSDELMMKFFDEEPFTEEETVQAVHDGTVSGSISPVLAASSTKLSGVAQVLDIILSSYPSYSSADENIKTDGNPAIFVFKTIADPFVGKMSFFKVMEGTLTNGVTLTNLTTGDSEKFARIYTICGKKQTEVTELCCGDIGMTAKLANTSTNDTLAANAGHEPYKKIEYPEALYTMAIIPTAKGDEDKISTGISHLIEEDYTLKFENDKESKQLVISGQGDIHLDVVVNRLKSRHGTSVTLTQPKIAYRETIKKKIQVQGRHKKQSGGHGQYGDVLITFSPGDPETEGLNFTQSVVGGTVPKNFYPAIEKGLQEAMLKGVLAGYPMISLNADLYDGSYHPVDSSEMSFKIAASLAYKKLVDAGPALLEPIGAMKVLIPDDNVGDIISDLNKRRGRVLGMHADDNKKGYQIVEAEVPKSEMSDYTIALRAITAGLGTYTFNIVRYEEVPAQVAEKVVKEAELENEDED